MKKFLMSVATIIGLSAVMVACNKDGGGNSGVNTPCGNTNQPGYVCVGTQMLPVCPNQPSMVMMNGQCVTVAQAQACGVNGTNGVNNGYNYNGGYNGGSYNYNYSYCQSSGYNYQNQGGYYQNGYYPTTGYYPTYPLYPVPVRPGFMGGAWYSF